VANNKQMLLLLCVSIALGISACAHKSKVKPSTGHIDGTDTSSPQPSKKSVYKKPLSNPLTSPSEVVPDTSRIPKPVTNNVYLPPPTAKAKEPTYSIVVYDTPVKEVLFAIARDSKLNVDIHPSIQGRVTLNAVDQTLPAILERLSKQVDLTYNIHGNVLTITPDQPVLRTYKIDYVNISRDTIGSVGVASEIASTGKGASTGSSGSATTSAANSSRTLVSSESKNHFWATLIANIKDLLAETDKEVIVTRFGSLTETSTDKPADVATKGASQAEAIKAATEERNQQRSEYKTLFAAKVIANPEAGVISVRGTNKQHERVQEFLDQVMNSAKRQVLIEATIVEVSLSDAFKAGIDWNRLVSLGGSGFILSQVLGPQVATSVTGTVSSNSSIQRSIDSPGVVAGYVNANRGITSSIQLLKQFGDTKVLSSPKLMVLNNQTAVLKVVDNIVYFTIESELTPATVLGALPTLSVTTTPHTVPVGVVMSVTPQITSGGQVNVNVRPTISRVVDLITDPNPLLRETVPSRIPQIQVQEMESLLQISSGNTAVLGGLMQDQIRRNSDKVPGLGDVPIVGKVFTGRDDLNAKTELVIFLRPTVIGNASLESDELASYKQYLPAQQLSRTLESDADR